MERDVIAELKTRRHVIWVQREPLYAEFAKKLIFYGSGHNEVAVVRAEIDRLTKAISGIDLALGEIAKLA